MNHGNRAAKRGAKMTPARKVWRKVWRAHRADPRRASYFNSEMIVNGRGVMLYDGGLSGRGCTHSMKHMDDGWLSKLGMAVSVIGKNAAGVTRSKVQRRKTVTSIRELRDH